MRNAALLISRVLHKQRLAIEAGSALSDAEAEEAALILQDLRKTLEPRPMTPVCVGSGATSAKHKMRALLHQIRLEVQTWSDVCSCMNYTVSSTTDMGTESHLVGFAPFRVHDVFPWMQPDSLGTGDFVFENEGGAVVAADRLNPLEEDSPFDFSGEGGVGVSLDQSFLGADEDDASHLFMDMEGESAIAGACAVSSSPAAASLGCGLPSGDNQDVGPHEDHVQDQCPPAESGPRAQPEHLGPGLGPDLAEQLIVDTTAWLPCPGLLHTIHNATKELPSAMRSFDIYLRQLKLVCDVLRRQFSKERLIETCFGQPPACYQTHLVKQFQASVYTGRWGSIASATVDLAELEAVLRFAWDVTKFNRGKPLPPEQREDPDDEHSKYRLNLHELDRAIKSAWFWSYRQMMQIISETVMHLINFSGSCDCHSSDDSYKHFCKNHSAELAADGRTCPMSSLLLPTLATGGFRRRLAQIWHASGTHLMLHHCQGLTEANRDGSV